MLFSDRFGGVVCCLRPLGLSSLPHIVLYSFFHLAFTTLGLAIAMATRISSPTLEIWDFFSM